MISAFVALPARGYLSERCLRMAPKTRKRGEGSAQPVAKRAKPPQASTDDRQYFLVKSEPESRIDPRTRQDMKFSIDDLAECKDQTSMWDGVRNYQARNVLRAMQLGDQALFYHSNCKVPGIIGIVDVVREAYPDPTQFDSKDAHYDPKSPKEDPRWVCVDVKLRRKFAELIPLPSLKTHSALKNMVLLKSGRLSVQPVTAQEFDYVVNTLAAEHDAK